MIMAHKYISATARFLTTFAALLILIGLAFSQAQPTKKQRKEASDLFDEARKSIAQRNYRGAVDQLGQSLAIVPNNPEAHLRKGQAHYFLKEYDQAISELDIALSQGYRTPFEIYIVRLSARYDKGDYDGALADVREALKIQPNNAPLILKEADINAMKGNDQEALVAYQKAVAQDPRDPNLYYKIAALQAKLGNTNGQVSAAEEAIKRNTQYLGDAFYLAADGYVKQKRYEEAEQAYTRAIDRWKAAGEKKQEIFDAYRSISDIDRRLNKFDDAIRITKQAMVDYPNNGTLYTDISWYYSLANKNQEAIDSAKAGVQLLPKEHLAYTNLCRAYNDTAQYQLAINACNAALAITPGDGETYFYLGRAYDLTNRSSEAKRNYDRAVKGLEAFVKENADYSDGFYLLGNAYFADAQPEKAIAAYTKCLELSPRFVKARYNLGIVYAHNNNKAAAMEQYNALLSLDPSLAGKLKAEIDKQ
jgi:tetratricopeptide (TPR) repeat protein